MITDPITTNRKYASAMEKAVEKSVRNHPYKSDEQVRKIAFVVPYFHRSETHLRVASELVFWVSPHKDGLSP